VTRVNAPLQLTFPIDSETLDDEEVENITGRAHRDEQIAWLTQHQWHHEVNRRGDVIIGRLYARLKLAGVDLRALAPGGITVTLPDFSKAR
jgi:hypothetical protein